MLSRETLERNRRMTPSERLQLLDEDYLRRWAKELNVESRLEAALAEYGET